MVNKIPFFSIITPAFNRASVLEHTIPLVLNQSFTDFEWVIADDGSSDNTREIVANIDDQRIRYFYQSNQGVCAARNMGAQKAIGKYLIFLDSDDAVEINWLNDFETALASGENQIAFCSVKVKHSHKEKLIDPSDPYNNKKDWGVFLAGAFAIERNLFFKIGMYDTKVKFGENTELSYRIKKENVTPVFIHSPNLIYHPSAGGGSKNLQNRIESNLYILQKHEDWFNKRPSSKRFYLQTAGIASYKLNKVKEAKNLLTKAWLLKPLNVYGFLRIVILNFPFLAKKMWKPKID